ncbi:hypothetical protein T484DRAFT_1944563 [Baffinella frigidus]|nr:hypothetical protein T484DRAFT_1944563 [Cryptophyta sp. CCMP2293]
MKRVEENGEWSLFCPCECPGLSDCWGEEFEALYATYEAAGKARKIVEYTAPDEVAVCNLASIGLPMFIDDNAFNHQKLYTTTKVITRNLNKVIEVNFYPVEEARRSNFRHRPIGLGVQGLADVFQRLNLPFDCEEARTLNKEIMETIYFAAFAIVNPHLLKTLTELGLWGPQMKNRILANKGSIQGIQEIPEHTREVYKTVWELKMRSIIDMAADRGAFIDQSQSLNLFVAAPTAAKLTSMHFYSWKKGLKTGCYYLRTRPAADAIAFTVDTAALVEKNPKDVTSGENVTDVPSGENVKAPELGEKGANRLARNMSMTAMANKENAEPNLPAVTEGKVALSEEEEDAANAAVQLAASKLMCSLANPGACEMCSA